MAPLAQALVERGHEVAFATAAEFCPKVERVGFAAFPAGLGHEAQLDLAVRKYPHEAAMVPSQERFLAFVPRMLAGVAAPATLADLVPLVERWRPDLIVHDEAELAGPIAATMADLPYAGHGVGIMRPWSAIRLAGEVLAPVARQRGVDVGPLGGMFRSLYLGVCPPGIQAPHVNEIDVAHPIRVDWFDGAGDESLPSWVQDLPSRPTVYLTLGTIFNRNPGLFKAALEGLRHEDLNIVVTVGHDGDPAALGAQPANVHVERYLRQSLLLPYCDLMVAQGGWSFMNVLSHGIPMLLMPMGANQFYHTQACVDAGAARRLMPSEVSPEAIGREVRRLLDDPSYRDHARRIQAEIASMPSPADAVPLVEELAATRRPVA